MKSCRYVLVIALLVFNAVKTSSISVTLYQQPSYDGDLTAFRNNAANYRISLESFLKHNNPMGKFDANVRYIGNIDLGFPHQRIVVMFDTSFSGFWVISRDCYLSFICYYGNKVFYDNSKSADYEKDIISDDQQERTIDVGTASLWGKLGFDTLSFTNFAGYALVHGVNFLEATQIDKTSFGDSPVSGVFGLGFPSAALKMAPPFFTMLDRGVLNLSVFSVFPGGPNDAAVLTFGEINQDYYKENTLYYHSINQDKPDWSLEVSSIRVQQTEFCEETCRALIDMGSELIAAPVGSLMTIYTSGQLIYTRDIAQIDCSKRSVLPNLVFVFGNQTIILTGEDYTIKIDNDGTCVMGLTESPLDSVWVLGNVFLAKVYTIFDVAQMRIGFASLN